MCAQHIQKYRIARLLCPFLLCHSNGSKGKKKKTTLRSIECPTHWCGECRGDDTICLLVIGCEWVGDYAPWLSRNSNVSSSFFFQESQEPRASHLNGKNTSLLFECFSFLSKRSHSKRFRPLKIAAKMINSLRSEVDIKRRGCWNRFAWLRSRNSSERARECKNGRQFISAIHTSHLDGDSWMGAVDCDAWPTFRHVSITRITRPLLVCTSPSLCLSSVKDSHENCITRILAIGNRMLSRLKSGRKPNIKRAKGKLCSTM